MVKGSETDNFFRVFSVGIGNGASEALCSGIARVGNGVCFMTTQSEEIKDRCSKILRAARAHPHGSTSNLIVDWGYDTVPRAPPKPQAAPEPEKKKKPVNFFDRKVNPFKDIGLGFVLPPPSAVLQAPTQPPNFYRHRSSCQRDSSCLGEYGRGACASRAARHAAWWRSRACAR